MSASRTSISLAEQTPPSTICIPFPGTQLKTIATELWQSMSLSRSGASGLSESLEGDPVRLSRCAHNPPSRPPPAAAAVSHPSV